jgi:hypothetical protein
MFAPAPGTGQDRRMVFDGRSGPGGRSRRDVSRPVTGRRHRAVALGAESTPHPERKIVMEAGMGLDEPETDAEDFPATMRLDGKVALVTGAGSPDGIGTPPPAACVTWAPGWRSCPPPAASTNGRPSWV